MVSAGGIVSRTFEVFSNHDYRLLWTANFFSYISRWMQMTLLSWFVLELTDSAWSVALIGFFGMAPMLVLGIFGGVLADRVNKRRLLITTQSINLLVAAVMAVLLFSGQVVYWHAYVIILISGIGWSLDMPSRRSAVLDLVGRSRITNAIALDSVGMHSSKMLGPAIAGLLITLVDVKGGYVAVTILYLVSVVLMRTLNLPKGAAGDQAGRNIFRNLAEGFNYVRSNNTIMAVVLITIFMNLLLFPYMQMIPVIAKKVLDVGPGLMGLLMAADGLGALIGSVFIASSSTLTRHGRIYLGGSLLALFVAGLFAYSQWYAASMVLLLILGFGTAGFGTMQGTIIMLIAREDMRGRSLGIMTLAIGAGPLGALLIGAVADATSTSFAIGINAVIGLVAVGLIGLLMPSLRQRMVGSEREPAPSPAPEPTQADGAHVGAAR
ncbi:MAG: MFS transporter [Chloroflexi bacterium]|nr:MFS transporter [Chloroflexota bacterium]